MGRARFVPSQSTQVSWIAVSLLSRHLLESGRCGEIVTMGGVWVDWISVEVSASEK